ncbi:diguanylate cyclase [Chromobacterium sp. IIBBL 290-4]|uniref:sensor domain-containing diguanylate cyclase n=1 Tax=Chromobacterium sp. IIBBL 290-4 TaxID=2953890 RepID=UPI0020B82CC4|nr:diguanylate cyclase [Chromobacterium sp. IIBBL 290-4]UTH74514.1 diguanylate cyclase [Chromobacterium sp. IIBBL 290-4]
MTHKRSAARSARHAKWGAGLFLLVTLGLVALDLVISYRQVENEAGHQASGLSQLLAERLSSGIHEAGLILQGSNQIPEVQKLLRNGNLNADLQQNLGQKLAKQLQLAPYLSQIEIVDTACQTVFSSNRANPLHAHHNEFCRWLHRMDEQDSNYTAVMHSPAEGGIVLANKLHDEQGNLIGMSTGLINHDFFQDEVSRLTVGEHGEILVLDQRQLIVARWPKISSSNQLDPQSYRPLQPHIVDNHDANQMLFSAPSSFDGSMRLYSIRRTGNYPFEVAVGISRQDFTRYVRDKAWLAIPGWLFVAALTLLALRKHLSNLRQHQQLLRGNERIRESEEQARGILDIAPLALLLVNPRTRRIRHANAPARELLRLPPRDSQENASQELNLPLKLQPVEQWLQENKEVMQQEVELTLEDQSKLWAIASLHSLQGGASPSALIALYDISGRKQLEQQLHESNLQLAEMAVTDPLTRLYNRRHADMVLRDEINRCERYGQTMSIAVFDIDYFKKFNDQHGHQAGDDVLVAVANALRDSTRTTDINARVGGEEFLVIFPYTRLRDANKVMQRMQMALSHTTFPFVEQHITFSAGLTDWRPGDTPAQMIARADKLLYQAKLAGRNIILCDQDNP